MVTPRMMETKESLGSMPASATTKIVPYIGQHTKLYCLYNNFKFEHKGGLCFLRKIKEPEYYRSRSQLSHHYFVIFPIVFVISTSFVLSSV